MILVIFGLICSWFLFIAFMVNENYITIKADQIVIYAHNRIMTGFSSIILAFYYVYFFGSQTIIELAYVWLWLLLSYWLVFDIWLNLKRKDKGIQYLGTKSLLDRFLRKYSFGQPIAFKLICILILNISYFYKEIIVCIMDIVAW